MSDNFQNAVAIIAKQEEKFIKLVESSKTDVMFKNELLFASQAMMNNDYLCKCATTNPLSLRNAFSQVAAYGLTLNQSRQLAYLVPRDGQVVLDVSWPGCWGRWPGAGLSQSRRYDRPCLFRAGNRMGSGGRTDG